MSAAAAIVGPDVALSTGFTSTDADPATGSIATDTAIRVATIVRRTCISVPLLVGRPAKTEARLLFVDKDLYILMQ